MRRAWAALLLAGAAAAVSSAAEEAGPAAAVSPAAEEAGADPAAEPDQWVVLETDVGEIWINLFEERAPVHAENFKKLVRQGWYDGSPFHRVIAGFVAQGGGKWTEDGRTSDVGYTLPAEISGDLRHVRGAVAAARLGDGLNAGRRSSGSQFYICLTAQPQLDRQYTIIGQVIHGFDAVDALHAGPPGKDGAVSPKEASVIRKAWLRDASPPGSAPAVAHHHDRP